MTSNPRAAIAYGDCPHAERPTKARGQCNSCYLRDLKVRNPATAAKQKQNHKNWIADPDNKRRHNAIQRKSRRKQGPRPHQKYGITRDEYVAYMSQPCGICGEPSKHLDHCHKTGRIRGGLCHRCNLGLGYYEGWYAEHTEAIHAWVASGEPC